MKLPLGAAILVLLCATELAAQNCFMCHEDPEAKGTRAGREISVFVDEKDFTASAHAGLTCAGCHKDLAGEELEAHMEAPEETEAAPVDCGACHEERANEQAQSAHAQAAARGDALAPSCVTCHSKHAILSHTNPRSPTFMMNVPYLCGQCHHEGSPVSLTHDIPEERILENYSESLHAKGLYEQGLIVTAVCSSCHSAHRILPHTDPQSTIHPKNVVATCMQCHANVERVHVKVIEGRKWEEEPNQIPACAECHAPHKPSKEKKIEIGDARCLRCHGEEEARGRTIEKNGERIPLYVESESFNVSAHRTKGVGCGQCHIEVDLRAEYPERGCKTIRSTVDCSMCHAEQVADYRISTHGTLHARGDPNAPACADCHSNHATLSKRFPTSPTYPPNVPGLCGRCHRAGHRAAVRISADVADIVGSYEDSVHGRGLLQSGLTVTATCASCHSAHRELPPSDPRSTVSRENIAGTCGKCHSGIERTFQTSIHWPFNGDTDKELPTCKSCHSSHTISRTDRSSFQLHMADQCGKCHAEQTETFFDTYHGKVSRLGSAQAAKCYDCHGTHNILPVDDPRSTLSHDNVVETCGKCHDSAHRRFAGYLTHATHKDPEKYPYVFWSFWGMTALLVGTLVFALLHTAAWLYRLVRTRKEWKAHAAAPPATGERQFVSRFTATQRTLHFIMLLSFFTLAITGMTLKFSYTGWALVSARLLGGFESMGILHRIGAVVLVAVFSVHLWDVWRQKKKMGISWLDLLRGPNSIAFNLRDVREFGQSVKWFLGLGPRPRYGRYTYWEKFDYFAVFWGVAVIGSSGLMLWFPELMTHVLPGHLINVAMIIHSDEALLAVGFIFTVHFFNTHFRPDKFPMDPVIFTGRVSLEEMKFDKPDEYERLVAAGELAGRLVQPVQPHIARGVRIFGLAALAVGLIIIALILYGMIFAYR